MVRDHVEKGPMEPTLKRVAMNCSKNKPSLQDQQLNCYRLWMKHKSSKKNDKRSNGMLSQYLLGKK